MTEDKPFVNLEINIQMNERGSFNTIVVVQSKSENLPREFLDHLLDEYWLEDVE